MLSSLYHASRPTTSETPLISSTSSPMGLPGFTTSLAPSTLTEAELINGDYTSAEFRWGTRINSLLQDLLIQVQEVNTIEAAQTRLAWLEGYLSNQLDKDLFDQIIPAWWATPVKRQREAVKLCLIRLALEAYIDINPDAESLTILSYGISLFNNETMLEDIALLAKLRLYKLRNDLPVLNEESIAHLKEKPLQVLRAVLTTNHHGFPDVTFWHDGYNLTVNAFPKDHIRSLDQAVLLWNQLEIGTSNGTLYRDWESFLKLRTHYLEALAYSYRRQKIIDRLFTLPSPLYRETSLYFDGFAFINAQNKLFNDLIHASELESIADYRFLSPTDKGSILQEAFEQWGESSQYRIGSIPHSVASCLIRIYKYQYHQVLPSFSNEQQLIYSYFEMEKKWEKSKNYPIHPRQLLAMHFAKTNAINLAGKSPKEKTTFLLKNLATSFSRYLERISPSFDRPKIAFKILKSCAMLDTEIYQGREYIISEMNLIPNQPSGKSFAATPQIHFGNAVDEFLAKAENNARNHILNSMDCGSQTINPSENLLKEKFNEQLIDDPWIKEKAKYNLRRKGISPTSEALVNETNRVANEYKSAIENHQEWTLTTKNLVYFVPVVGSLYTIEDGIRDKSLSELLLGICFLSLDAWGFWALRSEIRGGIVSLRAGLSTLRVSARETMTINSLRTSLDEINIGLAELPQRKPLELNQNPFLVSPRLSQIPEAGDFLVNPMNQGNQAMSWQGVEGTDYQLIHLADEDRMIPVKHEGGHYREINWTSGKVMLTKPLIYRDSATGLFTVSGLKGGGRETFITAIEPLSSTEMRNRYTVQETIEFMTDANDAIRYPNFQTTFKRFFTIVKDRSITDLDAEIFYEKVYQKSPTFRRIFNKFKNLAEASPEEHVWRIEIKRGQGCRTSLQDKIIYLDPDIEQSTRKYLSANYLGSTAYTGESFDTEQAAIHELLHALLNKDDLSSAIIESASPAFGNDIRRLHRGGITYLEEKIAFEGLDRHPRPARLVYRFFEDRRPINIDKLIVRALEEKRYLNNFVDRKIPLEAYETLGGEELSSRYVVRSVQAIFGKFKPVQMSAEFSGRWAELISTPQPGLHHQLYGFFRYLYDTSPTFEKIFNQGYSKFVIERRGQRILREPDVGFTEELIPSEASRTHYIVNEGSYYLSDNGFSPLTKEHRYLFKILEILNDDIKLGEVPEGHLFTRSPIIQLTDKIFAESGGKKFRPRCLAEVFLFPGEVENVMNY